MTCTSNLSNLCPNKIEPSCLTELMSLCGSTTSPSDFMQCLNANQETLLKNKCSNLNKLQDCFYCSLLESAATNAAGESSLCEWPNLFGKESCLGMNLGGAKCCKWTPPSQPPSQPPYQPTPPIYPPTTSFSATSALLAGFVAIIVSGLIVLIIWLIVRKKSKRS